MDRAALIDEYLPDYDVVERHRTFVRASRGAVYEAVRGLDMTRSPVIRALFALRSAPALMSRFSARGERLGLTLDGLLHNGFILLGERPGEGILLGLVGRFWTPSGGVLGMDAGEFATFRRPDYAKAAWDFRLSVEGDAILLTTETRILCTDEASRKKFRLYWALIGPFSGLVRKEILRAIKSAAEDDASARAAGFDGHTIRKVTT